MVDWRISTIVAVVTLSAFAIVLRKFFDNNEDWRIMIPIFVFACLLLGVYYLVVMKEVKYTSTSLFNILALSALIVVSNLAIYLSIQSGPLNVVIPIINLNTIFVVILSVLLLGEEFTLVKGIGILLGIVSVYLVMNG